MVLSTNTPTIINNNFGLGRQNGTQNGALSFVQVMKVMHFMLSYAFYFAFFVQVMHFIAYYTDYSIYFIEFLSPLRFRYSINIWLRVTKQVDNNEKCTEIAKQRKKAPNLAPLPRIALYLGKIYNLISLWVLS